jgi:hypothetical protein
MAGQCLLVVACRLSKAMEHILEPGKIRQSLKVFLAPELAFVVPQSRFAAPQGKIGMKRRLAGFRCDDRMSFVHG